METAVKVYTDGSCNVNTKKGGCSAVFLNENNEFSYAVVNHNNDTTNNRMELQAVILALQEDYHSITIYTDSDYVLKGTTVWSKTWIKNDWKNRKHRDLWEILLNLYSKKDVNFVKVKAHSGDKFNEIADNLAKHAGEIN